MNQNIKDNKDNLIIGMLIGIQAEVQATRDIMLGVMTDTFKFSDAKAALIQEKYNEQLENCKMAIVGDIKANYISKNESINELLDKIFPPNEGNPEENKD